MEGFRDGQVCVLGLGYVGLTLSVAMADAGFRVLGVEIRDSVLECLDAGRAHFHEPGLEERLQRVIRTRHFRWAREIPPGWPGTAFFITVGTPLGANGKSRLDMIENVSREVSRNLKDGDLVVMRSTVKLGTTRKIVVPILESSNRSYELAFCPERTLEGMALVELRQLPQIVGGLTLASAVRASQIFQFLTPTVVRVSDIETAEMIKLIDNAQRDVAFAYANEVARACDVAGISAAEVIQAGKLGYPRTNLAMPGPVGGPCLQKDPHILVESLKEFGIEPEITAAARRLNERQPAEVVVQLRRVVAELDGFSANPVISMLGIAFKGQPPTDDLRGTMARPILDEIRRCFPGAVIRGFDAVVPEGDIRAFELDAVGSLDAAFNSASLVLILNNHPVFGAMPVERLAARMTKPGLIYDFWNFFNGTELHLPEGVAYMALGSHAKVMLPRSRHSPAKQKPAVAKKYLVTGGTGFIGSALVKRLVAAGHAVRVLDNNSRGILDRLESIYREIEFVQGDIRDAAAVNSAATGVDSIIHLSFINGTEFFYSEPEVVLDIGVRGMLNVLDACRHKNVRELVLASSSEVYQTPPTIPTAEDTPLVVPDVMNPRYSYGGGKLACELMAVNYGRTGFDRVMIFRPHNVYGADMGWEHVLPQFIVRAADAIALQPRGDVPFPIQGDGSQMRSFIHIEDFTDGLMTVLEKGNHLGIYHIGNPQEVTIRTLANKVFAYLGRQARIIEGEAPQGETQRRCPDISKLHGLGFSPRISLDEGLPSVIDWYVANKDKRPDRSTLLPVAEATIAADLGRKRA